jgi:hypothetical protein
MATILPFPVKKVVPESELTEDECRTVHEEAYALMQRGRVTGVSHHADGMYMCVFDRAGEPYFIGREDGVCYLFDPTGAFVARSRRFEIVVDALNEALG